MTIIIINIKNSPPPLEGGGEFEPFQGGGEFEPELLSH